jgi:hypothetical protein
VKKVLPLLLCFLIISVSFSQRYGNKEFCFTIDLPPNQGWSSLGPVDPSGDKANEKIKSILMTQNNSSDRRVIIQIIDNSEGISIASKRYRDGFKSSILKSQQGLRLVSEKVATLAGIPCYQLTFVGLVTGGPIYMRMMALNANGYQYNLTGLAKDTTQVVDPALENILKSFRFTEKPVLPKKK